ncbi:hypothetical protein KEM54_003291 [Ascosphaera aggregata]|nr:hypothetical protein KEM54_003291 [Ascosphaera aggregata]
MPAMSKLRSIMLFSIAVNLQGTVAGSLKDVKHVVIFMQENRSFNNYFGTMAAVRGFNDPNVQMNSHNRSTYHQFTDANQLGDGSPYLLPWYLGYQGGNSTDAIQCMVAGSNSYEANHASINSGLNNHNVINNTAWSWGYLKRPDIDVQFAIAEGWTIGDMYQESSVTSTSPNRAFLASGSINVPGGPQSPDQGGVYLDNNETPVYEIYEELGVSWQVYQDHDNFGDNPLAWFKQFQDAANSSALVQRGLLYPGLQKFYEDAKAGTLPEVSFVVGPMELSEHPPYAPKDGGWLQRQVTEAVVNGAHYNSSALLISFDGTPGEWLEDPYGLFGQTFSGPGLRVPFYIISPWTRGSRVFTEHADHTSQILFVEEWLKARGYNNVETLELNSWRREHMSNLVNAFDFDHPDSSIPEIPEGRTPHKNKYGEWDGAPYCQSLYPTQRPEVPYSSQPEFIPDGTVEEGHKQVIGNLTEGRYLVFTDSKVNLSLTHSDSNYKTNSEVGATAVNFDNKSARFVIHYYNGGNFSNELAHSEQNSPFLLSTPIMYDWVGDGGKLVTDKKNAVPIDIAFHPGGDGASRGYTLTYTSGKSAGKALSLSSDGGVKVVEAGDATLFDVYSVTYYN